jgi:peptidase E
MKKVIIVHGGYERRDNELNSTFYQEITKDLLDSETLLLVYFASEDEDIETTFKEQSERIRNITQKNINIELAAKDTFISQLQRADAVHFRGGYTPKLLAALKEYENLIPLLHEKKILSGSSAGAYALAKYGVAHSERRIREGLGLVPIRLVCHYESPELPPSQESYDELLSLSPELELVKLKDCEWRVFNQ